MTVPQMETPGTAVAAAAQAKKAQIEDVGIFASGPEKLKAALMARAALAGIGVYESFGGYVVGNGVQREVPDLRALRRCLGAMGVLQ